MYTIQSLNPNVGPTKIMLALQVALTKDGRFKVGDMHADTSALSCKDRKEAGVHVWRVPTLYLTRVRLVKAKPYCGNHPGPCEINPFTGPTKKRNTVFLEWDDWVAFHTLVNKVLTRLKCSANVWTLLQDVQGRMWIRKGLQPRVKWDYIEQYNTYGLVRRVWNQGTDDQFQPETLSA